MFRRWPRLRGQPGFLAGWPGQGVSAIIAAAGELRTDVAPDELTAYCLHALAAAVLPSPEAVRRLVEVTLAGLRPRPGG